MGIKKIRVGLIVTLICVSLVIFLIVFGVRFTGYAVSESEGYKLDIEIENNYLPGEDVNFKIVLYDEDNNKIDGEVNFIMQNYYSEIVSEGNVRSGEEIVYQLPNNAYGGPWKIIAEYSDIKREILFNVGELEKVDIKLERDNLVITNIGNALINEKKILIYIGSQDQTASISLGIGEVKKIRLTAPDGDYNIRVNDGEEEITFEGVSLTGNVIGLESVFEEGFFGKYPMISLFLVALVLLVIIIVGFKLWHKFNIS